MWVLFDGGFVSIVAKRGDKGKLCVRARRREDLAAFLRFTHSRNRILETPVADYRFRVVLSSALVSRTLALIGDKIDYDNFKSRVAEKDRPRAHLYADVWSTLYELQCETPAAVIAHVEREHAIGTGEARMTEAEMRRKVLED